MSIIPYSGRAAIAEAILSMPIHLAIGAGGEEWNESPPALDYTTTVLTNEIGRKVVHRAMFVIPDDQGEIILPNNKRYRVSLNPTRSIYLQFLFDYDEGVGFLLRELGIFVGTRYKTPPEQNKTFWTPEELAHTGTLLYLNYPQDPDRYNPQKRGGYETVITF